MTALRGAEHCVERVLSSADYDKVVGLFENLDLYLREMGTTRGGSRSGPCRASYARTNTLWNQCTIHQEEKIR